MRKTITFFKIAVSCLLACFFKCQNFQSHNFFRRLAFRACECWIKTISTMDFILAHLRNVMSFCFCRPCFSLTSYFPSGVRHLLLISYHMTTIRQSEQSSLLEMVRAEEYHNHFKTFLLWLKLCNNVVYQCKLYMWGINSFFNIWNQGIYFVLIGKLCIQTALWSQSFLRA